MSGKKRQHGTEADSSESQVHPADLCPTQTESPTCEVVCFIGPSQAGVTTQCRLIANSEKWTHVSIADLHNLYDSRHALQSRSTHQILDHRELVGSCLTVTLIHDFLLDHSTHKALLDGFPASVQDLRCWDKLIRGVRVACVVLLQCGEAAAVLRWEGRGRTAGEELFNRLKAFREGVKGVVDGCRERGWSVVTVDGERSVTNVNRRVRGLLPGEYQADG